MTSIAEKYAAQWLPNGEVSLADLIQAAVDEAVESRRHEVAMHAVQQIKAEIGQSVPVVAGGQPHRLKETELRVGNSSVGWIGCHTDDGKVFIAAAELASLREKAAEADELRKDADVGAAIQRAAKELPEGCDICINIENGSAAVELYLAETDASFDMDVDADNRLAAEIHAAIDAAIAQEGE